jgi:hypothetical protein
MNSVIRRLNADIIWDGLGYALCLIVGAIFALDCFRIQIVDQIKSVPDLGKVSLVVVTIFAFFPGLCCLFFYVVSDVTKVSGVARWMSWWWIWVI